MTCQVFSVVDCPNCDMGFGVGGGAGGIFTTHQSPCVLLSRVLKKLTTFEQSFLKLGFQKNPSAEYSIYFFRISNEISIVWLVSSLGLKLLKQCNKECYSRLVNVKLLCLISFCSIIKRRHYTKISMKNSIYTCFAKLLFYHDDLASEKFCLA